MKLKDKLALECLLNKKSDPSCVVSFVSGFKEGWDAALDWASKNAETKTIPMGVHQDMQIDVIDEDSILIGKEITTN